MVLLGAMIAEVDTPLASRTPIDSHTILYPARGHITFANIPVLTRQPMALRALATVRSAQGGPPADQIPTWRVQSRTTYVHALQAVNQRVDPALRHIVQTDYVLNQFANVIDWCELQESAKQGFLPTMSSTLRRPQTDKCFFVPEGLPREILDLIWSHLDDVSKRMLSCTCKHWMGIFGKPFYRSIREGYTDGLQSWIMNQIIARDMPDKWACKSCNRIHKHNITARELEARRSKGCRASERYAERNLFIKNIGFEEIHVAMVTKTLSKLVKSGSAEGMYMQQYFYIEKGNVMMKTLHVVDRKSLLKEPPMVVMLCWHNILPRYPSIQKDSSFWAQVLKEGPADSVSLKRDVPTYGSCCSTCATQWTVRFEEKQIVFEDWKNFGNCQTPYTEEYQRHFRFGHMQLMSLPGGRISRRFSRYHDKFRFNLVLDHFGNKEPPWPKADESEIPVMLI